MTPIPFIEQLGGVAALGGGAGGGFFAVKWFAEWVAGRMDKREARLDAVSDRLLKAQDERIDKLVERVEKLEGMLAECQQSHAKSEAEVLKLKAIIESKGIIDQKAQAIVAADRLGFGGTS